MLIGAKFSSRILLHYKWAMLALVHIKKLISLMETWKHFKNTIKITTQNWNFWFSINIVWAKSKITDWW